MSEIIGTESDLDKIIRNKDIIIQMICGNSPSPGIAIDCTEDIKRLSKNLIDNSDYKSLGYAISGFEKVMSNALAIRGEHKSREYYEMCAGICHAFPVDISCLDVLISPDRDSNHTIINSISIEHSLGGEYSWDFFEGLQLSLKKLVGFGDFIGAKDLIAKIDQLSNYQLSVANIKISLLEAIKKDENNDEFIEFFMAEVAPWFLGYNGVNLRGSGKEAITTEVMHNIIESNSIELGEFYLNTVLPSNFDSLKYPYMIDWHPGSKISNEAYKHHIANFYNPSREVAISDDFKSEYLYLVLSNLKDYNSFSSFMSEWVRNGGHHIIDILPLSSINHCLERFSNEGSPALCSAEILVECKFMREIATNNSWPEVSRGLKWIESYSKKSPLIKKHSIALDMGL